MTRPRGRARPFLAADLFCGAGGTSTGLRLACEELGVPLTLVAVNHWPVAIETHSRNHPDVQHVCASIESLDPRQVVPGGRLDLLVASPECTHHAKYYGTGRPVSVDEPLDTITAKDRFGLVTGEQHGYVLDIRFRMLQPHELAAAMSFPRGYHFAGTKGDAVRQIGNAVDVRQAQALCRSLLESRAVVRGKPSPMAQIA